jgi:hypothetical protein
MRAAHASFAPARVVIEIGYVRQCLHQWPAASAVHQHSNCDTLSVTQRLQLVRLTINLKTHAAQHSPKLLLNSS